MRSLPIRRSALLLALALSTSACFTVEHHLPPHTYFGRMPAGPGEMSRPFDHHGMKNWFLAGLFPWSSYNMDDLAPTGSGVDRIEDVQLETRFSPIDVLVWVIPGQVYGYYFWAPRTLRIQGREIIHK